MENVINGNNIIPEHLYEIVENKDEHSYYVPGDAIYLTKGMIVHLALTDKGGNRMIRIYETYALDDLTVKDITEELQPWRNYKKNMTGNHSLTLDEIYEGRNAGKIACIKMVKDRTGLGLKDAKDLVESEFARLGCEFFTYK